MQEICLIIPCYNEKKRLNRKYILDFVITNPYVFFCFVNDGSSDDTLSALESIKKEAEEKVYIMNMEKNSGKAEAVRQGIMHIHELKKFTILGFWDADFSTPLSELSEMIQCINEKNVLVIGSRVKRLGAFIDRKTTRHILGRIFATFSNWILKIPVYDSQCGAKIFKAEISEIGFKEKFISKWLFDVELLARIRNYYGFKESPNKIVELPLQRWQDVKGSKLKLKDYIIVPVDLLKIYFHYNKN